MSDVNSYEFLILGSGEAGKYLAWTMAAAGHRTAVIEREYMGGSCPNIACLPSKNLIFSAKVNSLARRASAFGVEVSAVSTNMPAVQERKRAMVEDLIRVHAGRYEDAGVDFIGGHGRFISPKTIAVHREGQETQVISGERVFLNVGTRASLPAIPGLTEAAPMTHVELLDLERVPEHLIVIGGGYVGLELAQAMRRFGSEVTVIESGPQLAGKEDPDVGEALLELFHDEGIQVLLDAEVREVSGRSGKALQVRAGGASGEQTIEGTDLLIAAGRTPNTDELAADHGDIELDDRGYVVVDERLQTTAPDVWALGDCAGSPQFTHVAFDDFRIVRDNLGGGARTTSDRLIPYCMFTDPELGRVGLNETEARTRGIPYRIAQLPMASVLRTRTTSERRGFMKMLVDEKSDRILGFTAFGAEASELLATVQIAMLGQLPFTRLRDAIFTHPTTAEGLTQLLTDLPSQSS